MTDTFPFTGGIKRAIVLVAGQKSAFRGHKNSPQSRIFFKNVNADLSRLKYKLVGLISN